MKLLMENWEKYLKEAEGLEGEEEKGHPGEMHTGENLKALQRYYDDLARTATDRKTAAMAEAMATKIAITIPVRYEYEEGLERFKEYLGGLKDEGNSYAEQAIKDIEAADRVLASATERRSHAAVPLHWPLPDEVPEV